jgi:hypothetical protein
MNPGFSRDACAMAIEGRFSGNSDNALIEMMFQGQ